jgi:hypothetical protein
MIGKNVCLRSIATKNPQNYSVSKETLPPIYIGVRATDRRKYAVTD